MIVVSDTSSISNLLQIHQLDMLHRLFGEVTITPTVRKELNFLEHQKNELNKISWIKIKKPVNQKFVNELTIELDLGESESIALAKELQATYLLICLSMNIKGAKSLNLMAL